MNHLITVRNPGDDKIGSSFLSLFDVLEKLSKVEAGDKLAMNLRKVSFIHPFLILPICTILKHPKLNTCEVEYEYNKDTGSYLNTIHFPHGFNPLTFGNWIEYLSRFQSKTYLPICQIPASVKDVEVREHLLTVFENILLRQLNIAGQMISVIKYLIGEAIDNIVDHADVLNGWIMVQNYTQKGFLDICITESGIGLLGSYEKFRFPAIKSDVKAMEQAINGNSTKQITETRGYGIDTSRRMLVEGLKGEYFLLSGSAMYVYTNVFEQIIPLNRNTYWPGTMLSLRIPKTVPVGFNYSNYLE